MSTKTDGLLKSILRFIIRLVNIVMNDDVDELTDPKTIELQKAKERMIELTAQIETMSDSQKSVDAELAKLRSGQKQDESDKEKLKKELDILKAKNENLEAAVKELSESFRKLSQKQPKEENIEPNKE